MLCTAQLPSPTPPHITTSYTTHSHSITKGSGKCFRLLVSNTNVNVFALRNVYETLRKSLQTRPSGAWPTERDFTYYQRLKVWFISQMAQVTCEKEPGKQVMNDLKRKELFVQKRIAGSYLRSR